MVKIGDRVKNWVNGTTGIATGRTEYLNGCRQFLVLPEATDKDGKHIEGTWWDEQYLEVVDKQVRADPFLRVATATAGGPSGSTTRATR